MGPPCLEVSHTLRIRPQKKKSRNPSLSCRTLCEIPLDKSSAIRYIFVDGSTCFSNAHDERQLRRYIRRYHDLSRRTERGFGSISRGGFGGVLPATKEGTGAEIPVAHL